MASRLHAYTIRRFLKILAGVILSLFSIAGISLLVVRAFTITNVVVDAPFMSIELDAARFGKNLLFLPVDKLKADLLNTYPLLAQVRFEKRFPGTLVVHLSRRNTHFVLHSAGNTYALDENGLVLGGIDNRSGYPELEFNAGILVTGNPVTHPGVKASIVFLRQLAGRVPVSRVKERDSSSIQAISGHTNIFLPQIGDMSAKADTLQTIVEGFRIKGTLPTVIDLRFEKPVITN